MVLSSTLAQRLPIEGSDLIRSFIAGLVIILVVTRARRSRQRQHPAMVASEHETKSRKRIFGRLLPWLEAATSIATVAALFLTYQALKDSNAQLELNRQQIIYAREAAQPAFLLKFLDQAGVECTYQDTCDPTRITIQQIGAAEQVNYSVNERLLFSVGSGNLDVYLSPWLYTWRAEKDPSIWVLGDQYKLPRDLQEYSYENFVSEVYVVDVFYADVFGVEHQKQWVLSPNFDGFKEEQESIINTCKNNVLRDPFMLSPDSADEFDKMISSAYEVQDLMLGSSRYYMFDKTLEECV